MNRKIFFTFFLCIFFFNFSFSQEKAEELYKIAKKYEAENNSEKAIEYYTKTLNIDSLYYDAYFNRGSHYINQKKWPKALLDYSKYNSIKPYNLECLYLMASCYYYTGEKGKALNVLDTALRRKNNYSDALKLRGTIYLEKQMINEAIADFQVALIDYDKDSEIYYMLAFAYDAAKDNDKALFNYKKAELGLYNDGLYNNIGSIYRSKQNLNEALLYFNKAISFNPNNGLYYYNKGLVLNDLGFRKSAIESWEEAKKLQFNNFSKEVEELLK